MKIIPKTLAKSICSATCMAVTLFCAGNVSAQASSQPKTAAEILLNTTAGNEGAHLSGVWRMTRTPISCQNGQQVAPSFQAIMTFSEDGSLTGYAVPPSSSPALGSPEYGLWKREQGRGNYWFTDLSYSYDQGGAFTGSVELTASIQLAADGNTLKHETKVDFFDANGAFLFSGCGRSSGTRFQ